MAKKVTFNKTDISVAEYDGDLLFDRTAIAKALGYVGSIPASKGAIPIILGLRHFYRLEDIQSSLNSIQGDRKTAVAGLIRNIMEEYPQLSIGVSRTENKLDSLTGAAKDWAVASVEMATAETILKEAKARESELFTKLQQERT